MKRCKCKLLSTQPETYLPNAQTSNHKGDLQLLLFSFAFIKSFLLKYIL